MSKAGDVTLSTMVGHTIVLALTVTGAAAVIGLGVLSDALIAWKFWAWFVTTGFGLPPITLATAVGLSCMKSWTRRDDAGDNEKTGAEFWWPLLKSYTVRPVVMLGMGWLIKTVIS